MPLDFHLHPLGVKLCTIGADDEIIHSGFVTPVVRVSWMLGVEVPRRPFMALRVYRERALVHLEIRIADNDQFV